MVFKKPAAKKIVQIKQEVQDNRPKVLGEKAKAKLTANDFLSGHQKKRAVNI